MKKNIVIIILSVIILGLGGYLVYDKVIDKDVNNNNEEGVNVENKEIANQRENYEIVGQAFSGIETYEWPTETIGKESRDPNNVVYKIEIPEILIKTDVTEKINKEIYEKFKINIEGLKSTENGPSRVEREITYNYNIKDDILFILILSTVGSTRSGGSTEYISYYYDIKEDKQYTLEEVLDKFSISVDNIENVTNRDSIVIDAMMPGMGNHISIYYQYDGIAKGIQTVYYTYPE